MGPYEQRILIFILGWISVFLWWISICSMDLYGKWISWISIFIPWISCIYSQFCGTVSESSCSGAPHDGCNSTLIKQSYIFSSKSNHNKQQQLGSEIIIPISVIRDLGVHLDSEVDETAHMLLQSASTSSVVCARYVVVSDKELTTRLVLAHAISTLDYFSSVLASLPYSKIEPLQRIQNAAAWLLFNWAVVC